MFDRQGQFSLIVTNCAGDGYQRKETGNAANVILKHMVSFTVRARNTILAHDRNRVEPAAAMERNDFSTRPERSQHGRDASHRRIGHRSRSGHRRTRARNARRVRRSAGPVRLAPGQPRRRGSFASSLRARRRTSERRSNLRSASIPTATSRRGSPTSRRVKPSHIEGPFGRITYDGADDVVAVAGGPGIGPSVAVAEAAHDARDTTPS